jgi:hypothetical protein
MGISSAWVNNVDSQRAEQMIPKGTDNLLKFATSMARGLDTHGLWLGVGRESIHGVRASLNQLERTREALVAVRSGRVLANKRICLADIRLKTWLRKARLVVMLGCGARWSRSWIETGFTSPGMRVPKKLEARISLARALVSFFARHPEFGVGFAEITAARGRAVYERVIQSGEMFELAKKDCALATRDRDVAENELRAVLKNVVCWLKSNLNRGDARWNDFGFAPAAPQKAGVRRPRRASAPPIEFVPPPDHQSHSVAAA